MSQLTQTMGRPGISFLEAIELMEKPISRNSPLDGTLVSTELFKDIRCEHCSKLEHLGARIFSFQHPIPINSMTVGPLLNLVEQDGTSCFSCAKVIFEKTRHLLNERANGEPAQNTAIHHAARCRSIRTLFHLISLVAEEGGNELVSRVLKMPNILGETALHEAVKSGNVEIVKLLLWAAPDLASISSPTSAMYIAISLGHKMISKTIHEWATSVSFAGPDKQNVLHAAVLFDKGMVIDILKWNASLIQMEDANGNTPLHLASITQYDPLSDRTLLREYKDASFRSNKNGLYPVHLSSSSDQVDMTELLTDHCPQCIFLRDPSGKTILHFAVINRSHKTMSHILRNWKCYGKILNVQDGEGNTALHLAVQTGELGIVTTLLSIPEVVLDVMNKEKKTALDLAVIKCEKLGNFYWEEHADAYIKQSLELIGAKKSCFPPPYMQKGCIPDPKNVEQVIKYEKEQSQQLVACSEKMTITSVLIASCTFASSFALPGGTTDEKRICGMFKLAKGPLFSTLAVSNWMAFICSAVATLSAMLSAMPIMDLKCRRFYVKCAHFCTKSSLTALVTTVSLLGSVTLAPDSKKTAALIWLGNPAAFFIVNMHLLEALYASAKPLIAREGRWGKLKFSLRTLVRIMSELWPMMVAAIWLGGSLYHNTWRVCPVPPVSGAPK